MNYKKIADALAICMPETPEERQGDCVECPYFDMCKDEEYISFPSVLALDIRKYFSKNWENDAPVQ